MAEENNTSESDELLQSDRSVALFLLAQTSELLFQSVDAVSLPVYVTISDKKLSQYYVRLKTITELLLSRDDFDNIRPAYPEIHPESLLEDFFLYDQEVWGMIKSELQNLYALVEKQCVIENIYNLPAVEESVEASILSEFSLFFSEVAEYIAEFRIIAIKQKEGFLEKHPLQKITEPIKLEAKPIPAILPHKEKLVVAIKDKKGTDFGSKNKRSARLLQLVINKKFIPLPIEEIIQYMGADDGTNTKLNNRETRFAQSKLILINAIKELQRGKKLDGIISFDFDDATMRLIPTLT